MVMTLKTMNYKIYQKLMILQNILLINKSTDTYPSLKLLEPKMLLLSFGSDGPNPSTLNKEASSSTILFTRSSSPDSLSLLQLEFRLSWSRLRWSKNPESTAEAALML